MDDLIASTGVSYRALACASFMDNFLRQVEPIMSQGLFFGTISADRKSPAVATRDIAAVAAQLLLDDSWSGNGSIPLLGPGDLSSNDMAQIMSEVLGIPVRYQQIPGEALKNSLTGSGMSGAMAQALVDMMDAKNAGLDDGQARNPEFPYADQLPPVVRGSSPASRPGLGTPALAADLRGAQQVSAEPPRSP